MADTEFFIDGVATKHFNDINDYFETVRAEIIGRYSDIDEDFPLRTLSVS